MKRVASIMAVFLAALLLLTSCGKGGGSSNNHVLISSSKPDPNAQIKHGTINNGYSYTSKYLGVFIRFVSGWEFKTDNQLKELNGTSAYNDFDFGLNLAVKSDKGAVDLDAAKTETGAKIRITYKRLPEDSYDMTAAVYLLGRLEEIDGSSANSGGICHAEKGNVSIMPQENSLMGESFTTTKKFSCLDITIENPDGTVTYQKLIAMKKDIFIAEVLLTATSESELEELLEMFENIPE